MNIKDIKLVRDKIYVVYLRMYGGVKIEVEGGGDRGVQRG